MNIENLISAANPVPTATVPTSDSPQARQVLAQVLGAPSPGSAGGRRRRRYLTFGAVLVAAAVAATALLLPGSPAAHRPPPGNQALATALGRLSLVASSQPAGHPPGPGQYQYTDSTSLNWSDTFVSAKIHFSVSYHQHRQVWIATNGSGRIKESNTDPDFASAADRAAWIAAGRPTLQQRPWDQRFGKHGLSIGPVNLLKLPTNPRALAALLFARKIEGGPPGPAEDFVQVGDLLRETDAPPALRAALFKVCAMIPGARLLGTVSDPLGGRGIGIAHWQPVGRSGLGFAGHRSQVESVLVFNPRTSGLVAEETFVTAPGARKATLTAWTVYLKSGVVDSVTSTTLVAGRGVSEVSPA